MDIDVYSSCLPGKLFPPSGHGKRGGDLPVPDGLKPRWNDRATPDADHLHGFLHVLSSFCSPYAYNSLLLCSFRAMLAPGSWTCPADL